MRKTLFIACVALALPGAAAEAQAHEHQDGMRHPAAAGASATPAEAGQATFAAIAEVVRILERDPATDWSRVSIERLRQHLVDMDLVTMRSRVRQEAVRGGARFTVTGTGETIGAIRRMTQAHGTMLGVEAPYVVTVTPLADGATVTVVARAPNDRGVVAKLRGLGFIGLLTAGGHHGPHHLALARGGTPEGHAH